MLWPIVLPFKITFWTLAAIVVVITASAPVLKWKRTKTFFLSAVLAMVAFIPCCNGIKFALDQSRFGDFEFQTFGDINDPRAERYLPTAATNIRMHKYAHGNGYRARYSISDADLQAYLDYLWSKYGEYSISERGGLSGEVAPARQEEFERVFGDLRWPPLENAVVYYSPTEPDGGGAKYYFDSQAGIAFQSTGYW